MKIFTPLSYIFKNIKNIFLGLNIYLEKLINMTSTYSGNSKLHQRGENTYIYIKYCHLLFFNIIQAGH